ncbi:MAG TPA: LURP-one-related family protein [Candidatus Limnocylindrales bacterium]|nr:LURP-one-related family protein [Candidatus Limnocylindrales bacterium]
MFRRRGSDAPASAYKMRERMLSIGDDFWIEDGSGQRVFLVDGKALRVRETLELKDAQGTILYTIKEKLVSIRDVMTIEKDGQPVATVKKALVSPLRERYNVEFANGTAWKVQGNIVDHEYEIEDPGGRVAKVSKAWFRIRDTYGIEVAPEQDDAMALAVAIVVDQMSHDIGR